MNWLKEREILHWGGWFFILFLDTTLVSAYLISNVIQNLDSLIFGINSGEHIYFSTKKNRIHHKLVFTSYYPFYFFFCTKCFIFYFYSHPQGQKYIHSKTYSSVISKQYESVILSDNGVRAFGQMYLSTNMKTVIASSNLIYELFIHLFRT